MSKPDNLPLAFSAYAQRPDNGEAFRTATLWLRQPLPYFGLALVAIVWLAVQALLSQERESIHEAVVSNATNLSVVLDREVIHTINALDRILLFLRTTHERNPDLPWFEIIKDSYTVEGQALQIAVIDSNGKMVTSTRMLHPDKVVDLSDREHFRAQRDSSKDSLYISKPMTGRASGKLSVQFARKLKDPAGKFDGIVVISLDATLLTREYSEVNLGPGAGLALIGDDGIVRSASGAFAEKIGSFFPGSSDLAAFYRSDTGSTVAVDTDDRVEIVRCVEGYPLNVAVALPGVAADARFSDSARNYRAGAVITSLLILFITASATRRRYKHERGIMKMARSDALTQLPNRAHAYQNLDAIFILPPEMRTFALHMIDLDGFKFVNDSYGHLVGDQLLQVVADRLKAAVVEGGEFVARLGGDEFAIIQPTKNYDTDAPTLAQRVQSQFTMPFQIGPIDVSIGVSIGYASALSDGANSSELMQAADLALYAIKSGGRGAVKRYEPGLLSHMRNRMRIEVGLRQALENDEFVLFYQPIVDATTSRIVTLEALIRWRQPNRSMIPPLEFIPVAEETGLIGPIGDWVLRKACLDIVALDDTTKVAVNCSARQFQGGGIVATVQAALAASGLPAHRLEIEITESMLINETQSVTLQLTQLREMGCQISMDDFGTGYSSLSYLSRYPINTIKIDRAFTSALGESPHARAVVKAVIDLAEAFNMETIAEGVENETQLAILREIGCTEVQGYLFSAPKPISAFGATAKVGALAA